MASNPGNAALAKRWFEEVWNQKRTEVVHELVQNNSICHTDHGDMVGPVPFLQFHAALLEALPDLKMTVEELVSEGESVVVRWAVSGTHSGSFQGRPATGRSLNFRGMTWIRYQDGKMIEGWDCWNVDGVVQQLTGPVS